MLIQTESMSFLSKQFFNIKVKSAVKECETIKDALRKKGILKREDERANLVIPSKHGFEIERKYFLFKGYNYDGSIKPLSKYKLQGSVAVEDTALIEINILVVDLYEKSIYLYESNIGKEYIEGYLIKEEKDSTGLKTVLFTKEKFKVLIKNTNNYVTYDNVEVFIDKIIL